jgi:hypothetical protein
MLWASTICELLAEAIDEFDQHEKDMGIIRSQIVRELQEQLFSLVNRNDAQLSFKRTARLRGIITFLGMGIEPISVPRRLLILCSAERGEAARTVSLNHAVGTAALQFQISLLQSKKWSLRILHVS